MYFTWGGQRFASLAATGGGSRASPRPVLALEAGFIIKTNLAIFALHTQRRSCHWCCIELARSLKVSTYQRPSSTRFTTILFTSSVPNSSKAAFLYNSGLPFTFGASAAFL